MKTMLKFSLLAATAIVANPAIAQDQADAGYNEASDAKIIIVTARKKEETLLDAPLAVSVVGEDELEQGGFTDITEITKVTPGAFVEAGGQNTNGFARINSTPRFRGISVLSGNPLQQTASVFLDGIYLSGGIETIGINELQRVEVIKGPQSALFGRNTFAGAINYVTKDPSNELRADLSATIATRNEYGVSGGVEGPLFDGVSFRVGGSFSDKQGHYDNVAVPGQRLGDEQQWSINGTLLIEPSDGFRLKLRGSYQEINDGPSAAVASFGTAFHNFGGFLLNPDGTVNLNDGVQPAPRNGSRTESVYRGQIRRPSAAEIGLNTSSADVQAFRGFLNDGRSDPSDAIFGFKYNPTTVNDFGLNLDALRLSAVGSIDLTDNIQFSFLGGYNKENFGFFADFDTSPDVSFTGFTARETEDYTIEGRLSGSFLDDSLNVSAGASYVKIDIAELGGVANFFNFPIFFGDIFRSTPFTSGAETFGIFGSIDYEFNDQFSITLEGRYQEDEISAGDVNTGLATPISPAKITAFLPRATLRYQPSDNTTLYATYSRGNLPGGFNPQIAELDATQRAELAAKAPEAKSVFGEEKLTNYELGWKQQHPDGIFAFNRAAFYMKRSDEIFTSIETVADTSPGAPNPQRTVNFTSNGATSNIYGIEVDAAFNISENFSLRGSFAYVNSTIASFPADGGTGDFGDIFGPAADVAGQEAPRFPPITISLGTTYEDDFNGFGDMFDSWFVRTDVFFTGDYFDSNANVSRVQPATDVNLRLGLKGESFGLEFFATNLFDETAPTTAQNFADTSFGTRTLPGGFFDFTREGVRVGLRDKRQFGLRFNATFR